MSTCQKVFLDYVKDSLFPPNDFKFLPIEQGPSFENLAPTECGNKLLPVEWKTGGFTFYLSCQYFQDGEVLLEKESLNCAKNVISQTFFLIGTGGTCDEPEQNYLVPSHRAGRTMEPHELMRFVMTP